MNMKTQENQKRPTELIFPYATDCNSVACVIGDERSSMLKNTSGFIVISPYS